METIYLVITSSGDYDTYRTHNEKAFRLESDANNYVEKYNRILNEYKMFYNKRNLEFIKNKREYDELFQHVEHRNYILGDTGLAWVEKIELF